MSWSIACKRAFVGGIAFMAIAVVMLTIALISSNRQRLCERGELFYEATGQCFPRGAQGPCNDTLVLEETYPKSSYGGCSCAYNNNPRTLLYHKDTNKCYFIFSQGFCPDEFWINMTDNGEPFCEKNICKDTLAHAEDEEVVPLRGGSCAILNKKAEGCTEVVQFINRRKYPLCPSASERIKINVGGISVPNYPCPVGSYRNIMGECVPKPETDIDFS